MCALTRPVEIPVLILRLTHGLRQGLLPSKVHVPVRHKHELAAQTSRTGWQEMCDNKLADLVFHALSPPSSFKVGYQTFLLEVALPPYSSNRCFGSYSRTHVLVAVTLFYCYFFLNALQAAYCRCSFLIPRIGSMPPMQNITQILMHEPWKTSGVERQVELLRKPHSSWLSQTSTHSISSKPRVEIILYILLNQER
jgi:hypothetical protein